MIRSGSLGERSVAACLFVATLGLVDQPRETTECGSNIVSSTVVATFCGHRVGSEEILDLFILWRGHPGWFQRRGSGGVGGGGSRRFGAGTKGHVSQHSTYGDVTISFDADFDANTVTIRDVLIPLDRVNAVLVDGIDEPDVRSISRTLWIEPRLPLNGDMNLVAVRRSRELLDYLQCHIPMPPPMKSPLPQVPVITVCEKLKSK